MRSPCTASLDLPTWTGCPSPSSTGCLGRAVRATGDYGLLTAYPSPPLCSLEHPQSAALGTDSLQASALAPLHTTPCGGRDPLLLSFETSSQQVVSSSYEGPGAGRRWVSLVRPASRVDSIFFVTIPFVRLGCSCTVLKGGPPFCLTLPAPFVLSPVFESSQIWTRTSCRTRGAACR